MKKIITLVIAAAMIAAMLAVAAGAQSIAPNGSGWDGDAVIVKKANPANVKKDGAIGKNEYERLDVNVSQEDSPIQVVYITGENLDSGFALLETMEFYFSWDEVHGFNFAMRGKPDAIQQLLGVKEGDKPEDDFLHNVGWGMSAETDSEASPTLYYALAKRTDNGNYLEGHYNQLGAQGNYNPVAGEEYVIEYDYSTGYCTIEWSVPLNNFFTAGGGEGSTIKATIWMDAGMTTEPDDYSNFYGISLGDFGYAVNVKSMINHVTYNLSGEKLPEDEGGGVVTPPGGGNGNETGNETGSGNETGTGTGAGTGTGTGTETGSGSGSGSGTGTGTGTGVGTGTNTGSSSKTGDPMIVMAAVAAVSAAGAVIIGKRRH